MYSSAIRSQAIELLAISLLAVAPQPAPSIDDVKRVCAIGHVALEEISIINDKANENSLLDGRSFPGRRVLLDVCPELRMLIAKKYRLATEADHRLADSRPGPMRTIFTIGVPKLSEDRNRATVTMGYRCKSMCGAGYEVAYVLQNNVWTREGPPRLKVLS